MPTQKTQTTQLPPVDLEFIKDTRNKHELAFLSQLHSVLSQVPESEARGDCGGTEKNDLLKTALALVCERLQYVVCVDRNKLEGKVQCFVFVFVFVFIFIFIFIFVLCLFCFFVCFVLCLCLFCWFFKWL
jgi:hypothetical protein